MPNLEKKDPKIKDLFVCVHGIGSQQRSATVRSVANRLASSKLLFGDSGSQPFYPQPLGYFHSPTHPTDGPEVKAVLLDDHDGADPLSKEIGVAEIFWADIPQIELSERRTLQEIKEWAHTVVGRARRSFYERSNDTAPNLEPDFGLAAQVLDEIIDTVRVIERLAKLGTKVKLPKINVRAVFEDFLGDVQFMAEFEETRDKIIKRFTQGMARLAEDHKEARFHIVAHSEGTVVSLLGLLQAMTEGGDNQWFKRVRSYMTIGSPIDKHLLLWPRLFEKLDLEGAESYYADANNPKIRWKNYYDYGDPVGFKLDSTNRWLNEDERTCQPFEGEPVPLSDDNEEGGEIVYIHDCGFARYPFPGKAHNDYWDDPEVFEHFLDSTEIVKPSDPPVDPPKTKWVTYVLSPSLPYVLSFLLFVGGVSALYFSLGSLFQREIKNVLDPTREILGLSLLLIGLTLGARIPRLATGKKRWGFLAFILGSVGYYGVASSGFRNDFGSIFEKVELDPTIGTILLALLLALFGLVSTRRSRAKEKNLGWLGERRKRWFSRGMRPFLFAGVVVVAALISFRLLTDDASTATKGNVIAALLGTALFFYFWWLAALIFDLGFVWHRYVRNSMFETRMHEWTGKKSGSGDEKYSDITK